MKKLYTVLLTALLLAICLVGFVSLVDEDPTESKLENRKLASKPAFSWSALLDGSYFSQLETYYSDTFPGREALLAANQKLNGFYHYSGSSDNLLVLDYQGGAEQGGMSLNTTPEVSTEPEPSQPVSPPSSQPDAPVSVAPSTQTPPEPETESQPQPEEEDNTDHLEYTAAGSVIIVGDRAMDVPYATDSIVKSYAQAVCNLHDALEGVRVISLLTPNAAQFYSPKDMHTGSSDQKAMIDLCYSNLASDILTVDAFSILRAHKDEDIYFRTDHHWTQRGAYYAYTAFCETLDWTPVALEDFETGQYTGFLGSMYNWSSQYPQSNALKENPDTLIYYLPVVETHAKYYADAEIETSTAYPVSVVYRGLTEDQSNKYLCFLGGDHPAMVIECDVPDGPVCLVLKDSYGNAFIPFLTSHYSKIIVIDPREFNQSGKPSLDLKAFTEQQGVDDLLVMNYPFMVSNKTYVGHLNHLIGLDMD